MIDCSCGSSMMEQESRKQDGKVIWQVRCLRCNATAPPGDSPQESASNWDNQMKNRRTTWTADITYRDKTTARIEEGNIESVENQLEWDYNKIKEITIRSAIKGE